MRFARVASLILVLILSLSVFAEEMPILEPDEKLPAQYREIDPRTLNEAVLPGNSALQVTTKVYDGDNQALSNFVRPEVVQFGASEDYTQMEGILTFRGSHYRDRAAWGNIGENPSSFELRWVNTIKGLDSWTGVGWTGQCSIVRWPEETVRVMNIYDAKKAKGSITEVLYATLDGHIYFYDLEDGEPTRDPLNVGGPIKGSLSVDPRGYPLLYCGQGIDEVGGKSVKIGTRIFSLITGEVLFFIDGHDPKALRKWYAFDCSPLIDAKTDTMLQLGENGIFYTVKLNSSYDPNAGTVSVNPQIVKSVYQSKISKRPGMENSLAVYNHYAFYPDNSGLFQCVDLNTMQPVWAGNVGDDTDSSTVIEVEENGFVALYTANEIDRRGTKDYCYMRKVNALTGEQIWRVDEKCDSKGDKNGAGAFATPAVGKGSLGNYVYFHIARTVADGGTLLCIDKQTGETVWRRSLKCYGWSSPVCLYTPSGKGYVLVGSASGQLRLLDGLTGDLICDADLQANIEGSPTVFENTLVVGTRGKKIIAIDIQ